MSRMTKCTLTLAVVLAGCGGPATVKSAEVEKEARTELSKSVGQQAPPVSCPKDLELEVGNTMHCQMDFGNEGTLGVTVKVTSVDGSDGKLSFVADEALKKS